MKQFDSLLNCLGDASAWLFFATGGLLTYEVLARYVFSAPTIWAAEISQMFLIWGVYLALPRTIQRGENIVIEVLHELLPVAVQQVCNFISLAFIAFFCAIVFWYGWDIAWDSFTRGRSTGTMLNIPNWWTEIVIPCGFGLAMLACVARFIRLARAMLQGDASTPEG